MKLKTLLLFLIVFSIKINAQNKDTWVKTENDATITKNKFVTRESFPTDYELFTIDFQKIKNQLANAQSRFAINPIPTVITLPNASGGFENFNVYEDSNFDAELQARFPQIRSYHGVGITDKHAELRMSVEPEGIQTMIFRAGKKNEFMEPFSKDGKTYAVYNAKREKGKLPFTCSTDDVQMTNQLKKDLNVTQSSTLALLNFRLALSCNGEYANYFGATSVADQATVLAKYNATLTRVNGVFQKDFAIKLTLVNATTNVIFYDPATDPYTTVLNDWNAQLQNTLSSRLTGVGTTLANNNAAYDVGHMFGSTGGGGNAGCIGCVCRADTSSTTDLNKGAGITSPNDGNPQGDKFDIDFVAHELGHQFGGNHTFTHTTENNAVNLEPGSGSTIMAYAGITNYDVQPNSDDYFHAGSIEQVQANMTSKMATGGLCATTVVSTPLTHSAPVVDAGLDYTIPISTPFVLNGSATDAGGGQLTYCWEQYDDASLAASLTSGSGAISTKVNGPNFRSYSPITTGVRYFPKLSTVLSGNNNTSGSEIIVEALSSVARTLNFRLTVRDNVPNGGQTNFDNAVVTVDATKGPFNVTSQNDANYTYPVGSSQTVTWTVNGTNALAANVEIQFSSNDGTTWTTLLASTPNDGTQAVNLPAGLTSLNCRFLVKAVGNVFYNVSKKFAVGYNVTSNGCNTFSNNTPFTISDTPPGNFTPLTVNASGLIGVVSSVAVFNNITHAYVSDVITDISSPANSTTFVKVFNRLCGTTSTNLDLKFSGTGIPIVCGNSTQQNVLPGESFTGFNGQNPNGDWTLRAYDNFAGDEGTLNSWSVEICTQTLTLNSENFSLIEDLKIFPNPNKGNFAINFTPESDKTTILIHDIRGRQIFENTYNNNGLFNQNIDLNKAESGIYLVTITDGAKKVTQKIIVE